MFRCPRNRGNFNFLLPRDIAFSFASKPFSASWQPSPRAPVEGLDGGEPKEEWVARQTMEFLQALIVLAEPVTSNRKIERPNLARTCC
jgi:hypothetical protein